MRPDPRVRAVCITCPLPLAWRPEGATDQGRPSAEQDHTEPFSTVAPCEPTRAIIDPVLAMREHRVVLQAELTDPDDTATRHVDVQFLLPDEDQSVSNASGCSAYMSFDPA